MPKQCDLHETERMVDELIELSMDRARQVAKRAEKAETIEEIEACAIAFERLTEDVCASIELRRKLRREREALQREVDAEAAKVAARRETVERLAEEVKGPRILH